jgi:hypothetical protein
MKSTFPRSLQIPAISSRAARLIRAFLAGTLMAMPFFCAQAAVTISKTPDGKYTLLRDGKPYFINGAGGTSHLDTLVACGGNSIRTWGIESLDQVVDGKKLIDRAQELGLSVTAGIWVGHERHGFNYSDQAQLEAQREKVRTAVRKWKNHPAVLIWGLGNEMEGPMSDGKDPRIWKELNVLAGIVKAEDPNHPVMTVIASAASSKIKGILENYPNIDILGVNAYAGGGGVGSAVKQAGWKKPFILTEFGSAGQWEVPKTKWGAAIEPSSWDKAANYYSNQNLLIENSKDICLGSYIFLWGQKQETTCTWYGMFLQSGEKLPTVDAMTRAWTGKWPANRSPKITSFKSPLKESTISVGQMVPASIEVSDSENDPLTYEWEVVAESTDKKAGGDAEKAPPAIPECTAGQQGAAITVKAPAKSGAYRLFVTVRDGKGGASKDNLPFFVQ